MSEESTTPDLVELTRDPIGVGNRHDLDVVMGHVEQRRGWALMWVHSMIERYAIYLDSDAARDAAERLAEERG